MPYLQNGVAVGIGFAGGISITSPALTGRLLLQSADSSQHGENVEIHDDIGNLVGSGWINPQQRASLKLTLKSATNSLSDFLTNTEAVVELIQPGQLITIGSCAAMPSLVGTTWELLDGPKVSGTNKTAREWTIDIRKSPGITAQVSA